MAHKGASDMLQGAAGGVSTAAVHAELAAIQADHQRLRAAMMQNLCAFSCLKFASPSGAHTLQLLHD